MALAVDSYEFKTHFRQRRSMAVTNDSSLANAGYPRDRTP